MSLLVVAWVLGVVLGRPLAASAQRLREWQAQLGRLEEEARGAGGVAAKALGGPGAASDDLMGLVCAARRRGVALAASLGALRRQVGVAAVAQQEASRLWRVLTSRMVAGIGLGALARAYLLSVAPAAAWAGARGRDASLQVGAALVVAVVLRGLARTLPRPWTGAEQLSSAALAWLAAHAGMPLRHLAPGLSDTNAPDGLRAGDEGHASELGMIQRGTALRELASGVSLTRERRERLSAWARDRALADRERCRSLEDWLPLLELAGIGLPVALLLLAPAMAWLARDAASG
jgi:hypothetical protein